MPSDEVSFEKEADMQDGEGNGRRPKIPNANSATPSRRGKKGTTIYFDVDTHHKLKQLALDQETTVQALLIEGVNLMLRSYNRKPTA
jgi:hypothetical protein